MGSWNATPSKENTVLTDWLTSRLPFWYSRGKGIHLLLWRTPSQCSFFLFYQGSTKTVPPLPSWNSVTFRYWIYHFITKGAPFQGPLWPSWNVTRVLSYLLSFILSYSMRRIIFTVCLPFSSRVLYLSIMSFSSSDSV